MLYSAAFIAAAAPFLAASVSAVDFPVTVGQGGLTFTPNDIKAAIGDTVTFTFYPKNHTVTQSAFATPCTPLVNATTGQVGFNSGYVPVAATATTTMAWTLNVTDTKPIWFFCAQGNHCQSGMVGAINAPATGNTLELFTTNAKTAVSGGSASGSAGAAGVGASATAVASAVPAGSQAPTSSGTSGAVSLRVGSALAGTLILAASALLA